MSVLYDLHKIKQLLTIENCKLPYTVMGSEVHLDIYDDRLTVTSPGGMYNGMLIQNLDINDVSSERRNPILANVMAQLNYMEKRGSGLSRICNESKALEGYKDD